MLQGDVEIGAPGGQGEGALAPPQVDIPLDVSVADGHPKGPVPPQAISVQLTTAQQEADRAADSSQPLQHYCGAMRAGRCQYVEINGVKLKRHYCGETCELPPRLQAAFRKYQQEKPDG